MVEQKSLGEAACDTVASTVDLKQWEAQPASYWRAVVAPLTSEVGNIRSGLQEGDGGEQYYPWRPEHHASEPWSGDR